MSLKSRKPFFLILLTTFFLWFVIQLTKAYNYSAHINLNIVNVPNHIAIDTSKIDLAFDVNANGLKLWTYNLSKQSIDLDFKLFEEKPKELIIQTGKIKSVIEENDLFEAGSFEFAEGKISIPYTIKDSKKVPVIARIDYQFADGYNSLEELKLNPDSVVVTGSNKDLSKISVVFTSVEKIPKVNQDLKGTIPLSNPPDKIKLSEDEVTYTLSVQKFSEKSLEAPINVINVPDSLDLSIYPQKAKLSFLVSLDQFDKITEVDFKITCDFNKRYSEEAIMIPVLEETPVGIKNVKLNTKKVDYLLVKKQ